MPLRDYILALQVPLFVAVLSPALVGTAVAVAQGYGFRPVFFGTALGALILIQAGTNVQKAYFESRDLPPSVEAQPAESYFAFDTRVLDRLPRSPGTLYRVSLLFFALAGVMGILLDLSIPRPGHVLLLLGLGGVALGFAYSGPPLRMSYRGLGEINAFLAFGPLAVVGVHYTQAWELSATAVVASLPLGCLTASISAARSFLSEEEDRIKGKMDPVVRLGRNAARGLLALLLGSAFILVVVSVALRLLPPGVLIFLGLLPLAVVAHRRVLGGRASALRAVKAVVLLDFLGGVFLSLGALWP